MWHVVCPHGPIARTIPHAHSEIKHYDDGNGSTTGATPITGSNPNNYSRPDGQNVGNFITDKPSSRVLAPPGGGQSFTFGGEEPVPKRTPKPNSAYKLTAPYQTMPEGMKADDVPYEVVNIDVPDFTPPNHKAKAAHKPVEPAFVIDAPKPSYGEVDDDTIVGAVAKVCCGWKPFMLYRPGEPYEVCTPHRFQSMRALWLARPPRTTITHAPMAKTWATLLPTSPARACWHPLVVAPTSAWVERGW